MAVPAGHEGPDPMADVEQPLLRQDAGRLPEGGPADPQALGEVGFARQPRAGRDFALLYAGAQSSADLSNEIFAAA